MSGPASQGDGDTLAAHRLARARSEAVQAALVRGGLPADSVASVWDHQFTVREPRVTLWCFARRPATIARGTALPGATARVAVVPGRAATSPARTVAVATANAEPAPGIHIPDRPHPPRPAEHIADPPDLGAPIYRSDAAIEPPGSERRRAGDGTERVMRAGTGDPSAGTFAVRRSRGSRHPADRRPRHCRWPPTPSRRRGRSGRQASLPPAAAARRGGSQDRDRVRARQQLLCRATPRRELRPSWWRALQAARPLATSLRGRRPGGRRQGRAGNDDPAERRGVQPSRCADRRQGPGALDLAASARRRDHAGDRDPPAACWIRRRPGSRRVDAWPGVAAGGPVTGQQPASGSPAGRRSRASRDRPSA